jgi:hypothetical protein
MLEKPRLFVNEKRISTMEDNTDYCIGLLKERGVTLDDIADCARYLQADYHVDLVKEELLDSVMSVLKKREVQFAIMTAIELDKCAEQGKMNDKLLEGALMRDEPSSGSMKSSPMASATSMVRSR